MDQAQLMIFLLALGMFVSIYGISEFLDYQDIEFDIWAEEEDDHDLFVSPYLHIDDVGRSIVNVDSFGASGNGTSDDTQAFSSAWNIACTIQNSVFLVPKKRSYLVNATRFKGPCAEGFMIHIAGEIIAPNEPGNWDPKNPRTWLVFSGLQGVVIQGGGTINGTGEKWWSSSCKVNKTNPCRQAPTAFTIDSSSGVSVKNLNFRDSQQIHLTIQRSDSVKLSKLDIQAPGKSPNTDGIHISESTNILIQKSKIGTGDDCISIINGSSNIKMKKITCGPGHGISIGSLGKDNSTAMVSNVFLDTATITGATNGLRIKTWQGGSGYVRAVKYQNVQMNDVANPIIIDQFYCDSPKACINQTSAVSVKQIMYINISGSSKTPNAMKFACSDTVPCKNIYLSNINLQSNNITVQTFCNSAVGSKAGYVFPSAECLLSDQSHSHGKPHDSILHTEL